MCISVRKVQFWAFCLSSVTAVLAMKAQFVCDVATGLTAALAVWLLTDAYITKQVAKNALRILLVPLFIYITKNTVPLVQSLLIQGLLPNLIAEVNHCIDQFRYLRDLNLLGTVQEYQGQEVEVTLGHLFDLKYVMICCFCLWASIMLVAEAISSMNQEQ